MYGIAVAIVSLAGYFAFTYISRPPYALEVDATRDTTDISGIMYRIRVSNMGTEPLTGVVAELGPNDIQELSFLTPGQSYYFYPDPETKESTVKVSTSEGISVETSYRSPTKVLGLPGAGR